MLGLVGAAVVLSCVLVLAIYSLHLQQHRRPDEHQHQHEHPERILIEYIKSTRGGSVGLPPSFPLPAPDDNKPRDEDDDTLAPSSLPPSSSSSPTLAPSSPPPFSAAPSPPPSRSPSKPRPRRRRAERTRSPGSPPTTSHPTLQPTFYPVDLSRLKRTRIVYPRKTRQPSLVHEFEPGLDDPEWDEWEESPAGFTFVPYANNTLAYEVERIQDFPKHTVDELVSAISSATTDADADESSLLKLDQGTHIITTFFRGTYSMARVREVLSTLVSNLENPYVAAVHVMWEGDDPRWYLPAHIAARIPNFNARLVLVQVQRQPTYKELFHYANTKLLPGAIAVVTNADIYYDASIGCVHIKKDNGAQPSRRRALALSRRHSPLCGNTPDHFNHFVQLHDLCLEYTEAHDSFVVAVPLPSSLLEEVNHTQNAAYGAENIVIHELRQANFSVFNSCHTVRGLHNHCVEDRHSTPSVLMSVLNGRQRHDTCWPSGKRKRCQDVWVR